MTAQLPTFTHEQDKSTVVSTIRQRLQDQSFTIVATDTARPWGAFFRVDNKEADAFIRAYFDGVELPFAVQQGERSPKILLVAPHSRLSWQYHDRRGEFWRCVSGRVAVATSPTDVQPAALHYLDPGETIYLSQGTRHRLIGLDDWGAVAEIWIHTDPQALSDEQDIHRVQDDFGRAQ